MQENDGKKCFLYHILKLPLFKRCKYCDLESVWKCYTFPLYTFLIIVAGIVIALSFINKQWVTKESAFITTGALFIVGWLANAKINKLTIKQSELNGDIKSLEELIDRKTVHLNETKELLLDTLGRMEHELDVVGELQKNLLPQKIPLIKGVNFTVHYQPSTQASGDYYDFLEITPGVTGIVVADVSGHGAAASVAMAITRVLMHGYAIAFQSPGKALTRINSLMRVLVPTEQFVTMFYGIHFEEANEFKYSSAGHPMPYLISGITKKVQELEDVGSFPLKIFDPTDYPEKTIKLEKGDKIVMFTDGLTEAMNHKNEIFGEERVIQLINNYTMDHIEELKEHIIDGVLDFVKGRPFQDDFTMLIMETEKQ